MDEFDNLFDENSVEEAVEESEVTEAVEETVEAEVEATAAVEEASEETVNEAVEEAVEEPINEAPQTVPVAVMIAERNRAKQAEEELRTLRQQVQQQNAAQRTLADPYDDPETYHHQQMELVREQIREEMRKERLNSCIATAMQKYGAEMIDELGEWAEAVAAIDPSFEIRAFSAPDPVEWTINERKRYEQRHAFESDPDAFVRQRAVELGYSLTAAPVAAIQTTETQKKTFTAPKSLVHASSRDGIVKSEKDEFGALFDK